MTMVAPVPKNELERLISLTEFDLDYSSLHDNFKNLTKLAATVAGTEISLVNLIDTFTQWTVSSHGIMINQMPREDSVCQYTIVEKEHFEVKDLSKDPRFKDKFYVKDEPKLKYYLGVPLVTGDGLNIGALCVLDKNERIIDPEKVELLKVIASEIVDRIKTTYTIEQLKTKVKETSETKLKVVHDIRGPLSGITGLAEFVSQQGDKNKLEEVLQFMKMIHKSGNSILDLANEILSTERSLQSSTAPLQSNELNLRAFKEKLEELYCPQAFNKKINFSVSINSVAERIPFLKSKLLQITGNLISNAIKFTPEEGTVAVQLDLESKEKENMLHIIVSDSGAGLDEHTIKAIINGNAASTNGTRGEQGYGFGLSLVKHLVDSLKGKMDIHSEQGVGSTFHVYLPQMPL